MSGEDVTRQLAARASHGALAALRLRQLNEIDASLNTISMATRLDSTPNRVRMLVAAHAKALDRIRQLEARLAGGQKPPPADRQ